MFASSSGSPANLNLGSGNGGGIVLNNGSVLHVSDNNLVFKFASALNPSGQTGQLGINGGDIDYSTSASGNSTFNFAASENIVDYLNLNATAGGASITMGSSVLITNGIKIKQGILNSNGQVVLESNATTTASIRQIEGNGVINGNVTVRRYSPANGVVYRYFSLPVTNVKVADVQAYFPVTGNFTGASTGTTAPSMFRYNEPSAVWEPFPTPGGTNQEVFEKGRGYSYYNWTGGSAYVWQVTGPANQGDVTFANLSGGSVASGDGWNLLGNPYASPVLWGNTGWTTSGVGSSIYIRSNYSGGFEWKVYNRSTGTGNLTNGKIPAGQSFWIQASNASPSVKISESAKSADAGSSNTEYYREGDMEYAGNITLSLTNGVRTDQTFITVNANGNDLYDKMIDSEKRDNTTINLSTLSSDSVKLAVNHLADYCQKNIALNIDSVPQGEYTLKSDDATWNGKILLIDRFTNTTVDFTKGESYAFHVDPAEPRSFGKKRFALEILHDDIDVNRPQLVTASNTICQSGTGVLTIESSQQGALYSIFNQAGTRIATPVTGTGNSIDFTVDETMMLNGANKFSVVAEWNGCGSVQLPTSVSINYEKSTITAPEVVTLCEGESASIKVSGAPAKGTYRWFDMSNNVVSSGSSATYQTPALSATTSYLVQSVGQFGCESEKKLVVVNVNVLPTPQISQSGNTFYSSYNYNNQWLKDGQPVAGATDVSFEPTEPGHYSVQFSSNGCSKVSETIPFQVTGIELPTSSDAYFSVFPNPTSQDQLFVKGNLKPATESVQIDLVDIYGKSQIINYFSTLEINNGVKIETSSAALAQGVYVVVLRQGGILTKRKVVIR
jgi:hypothetical protein